MYIILIYIYIYTPGEKSCPCVFSKGNTNIIVGESTLHDWFVSLSPNKKFWEFHFCVVTAFLSRTMCNTPRNSSKDET